QAWRNITRSNHHAAASDTQHGQRVMNSRSPHRSPQAEGLTLPCCGPHCASRQILAANVRFGSKADIEACLRDVRFTPKSGHRNSVAECPLCAKSGHCDLFDTINVRSSSLPLVDGVGTIRDQTAVVGPRSDPAHYSRAERRQAALLIL